MPPDRTRLEELRDHFHQAAYEHDGVEAVVIYRPDIRREENDSADRKIRSCLFRIEQRIQVLTSPLLDDQPEPRTLEPDEASARQARELDGATKAIREFALPSALWVEDVVPPYFDRTIEGLGAQRYWSCILRAKDCPDYPACPSNAVLWQCTLYGLPAKDHASKAGARRFDLLAEDATHLILSPPPISQGTALLSRWLIYLADRAEPLVPDARKSYLLWDSRHVDQKLPLRVAASRLLEFYKWEPLEIPGLPSWIPVTPGNFPGSVSGEAARLGAIQEPRAALWWAVRLPNVFQLSRDAIQELIDSPVRSGNSSRPAYSPSQQSEAATCRPDPSNRTVKGGRTPNPDPDWAATAKSMIPRFQRSGRVDWQEFVKELRKEMASGDPSKEKLLQQDINVKTVRQFFQNVSRRKG